MRGNRTRGTSFLLPAALAAAALAALFLWRAPVPGDTGTLAVAASPADFSTLDTIVEAAIAADELPGAVLIIGRGDAVLYRKAFGRRALAPAAEPMTVDTIFDLASLTKVLATATAVTRLIEQGKLRLNDPVARYIPEFTGGGKEHATLRHLLTHHSGLRPIPALPEKWSGTDAVLKAIYGDELISPPGARFVYSDTGYILLAELVRRASGMPLEEYFAREIAAPLGMEVARFLPPAEWRARIAPTEALGVAPGAAISAEAVLRGEVHDPRARGMGGVAGHAGLFATADDVARYCRMILAEGVGARGRVLAPASVALMTANQSPPWSRARRGLGFDIDTGYSAPRGELFPVGSFGHTGFTGTSIWMDPASGGWVVLLANSVHPRVRPAISSLRSRVATAAAAALGAGPPGDSPVARTVGAARPHDSAGVWTRQGQTKTGIDVLVEQNFAPLRGKRVGLITNHTGRARDGRSTAAILRAAPGVELVALLSPEHGLAGRLDDTVPSGTDPETGLAVHSLYGETRRPTDEMLRGIDALVFDIQDAGVRFYTYITTMAYAMEEAARRGIGFYVLDRPNPLGGERIEGPLLDPDKLSFVGYFPLPVVHGMTVGELARLFNAENKIGADLHVVAMDGWRRSDTFEVTGAEWIAPSPNLRSLDAAVLYPGVELLQAAGVSVGRGTDTPFELFGAPWIRAADLAAYLNRRYVPGVRFVPIRFTPRDGLHRGALCQGVAVVITDRASVHATLLGLEAAAALERLHPEEFAQEKIITLLGNAAALERLRRGDPPTRIVDEWADELAAFRRLREKYLLYR